MTTSSIGSRSARQKPDQGADRRHSRLAARPLRGRSRGAHPERSHRALTRGPSVILHLHDRYRTTGGEERAVAEIAALLRRRGHEVEVLERSSDALGRGKAALGLIDGGLIPTRSASPYAGSAPTSSTPTTLHPTLGCARLPPPKPRARARCFTFTTSGCSRDRDRLPLRRTVLRCRGTHVPRRAIAVPRLASRGNRVRGGAPSPAAPPVPSTSISRRGQRLDPAHLRDLGLPASLTATLPNFMPNEAFAEEVARRTGEFALAAGRLTEEKGFDTAMSPPGPPACRS